MNFSEFLIFLKNAKYIKKGKKLNSLNFLFFFKDIHVKTKILNFLNFLFFWMTINPKNMMFSDFFITIYS